MEVAVAEEKKKIFRARKTMKISDRQQLETLHSTLLSSGATLSNPSPPPMLNGRHKEDGHKTLDKERHDTSDSHSQATSPASPASRGSPTPSLSLNLSPSPPICQSPKNEEENIAFPTSPFRSLNFEPGKSGDGVMQGSPSNGSSAESPTETKAGNDTKAAKIDTMTENKKDEQSTTEPPATDSLKESGKNSVLNSSAPTPPPVKKVEKDCHSESDSTQDMKVVGDTTKAKNSTAKTKTDKPSSPKPSPSSSTSTILMKHQEIKDLEPKEEKKVLGKSNKKDIKDEVIKDGKEEGKKGATKVEKMEVDFVKVEAKKEKKDAVVKTPKSFRPSSTPPTETDMQETTLGLKRALSEGEEKEKEKVERDGKRPKMDGVELEAQLELKITAKAGSRLKLEKVVQQLVEDRLRVLQLTVFDQNLQELKDRVEKIDSATKHQSTLNTLQAKISRLTKKFGEANQALENKRKQEVLAAAAAATAATTAAAVAVPTAAVAAKAPGPSGSPSIPRLLRGHSEESQPGTPREGLAPSGGKTSALTLKKKKKKMMMRMREKKVMMMQEKKVMMTQEQKVLMPKQKATMQEKKEGYGGVGDDSQQITGLADRLANFSEGDCRADIKLRPISSQCEKWVYKLCRGSWATPRADRYASYIFRNLVHYETYCDWVLKVNYVGVLGKDALPRNLRKTLRTYIEKRFTELTCDHWREIRDSINELLRVERRPEFFQTTEEKIPSKYTESTPMSS